MRLLPILRELVVFRHRILPFTAPRAPTRQITLAIQPTIALGSSRTSIAIQLVKINAPIIPIVRKKNMPKIRNNPTSHTVITRRSPRPALGIPRNPIITPIEQPLPKCNILIPTMLPDPLTGNNKLRTALRAHGIIPTKLKMESIANLFDTCIGIPAKDMAKCLRQRYI